LSEEKKQIKICSKCGIEKSVEEFHRQGKGYRNPCKECRRKYDKKYRKKHRKKLIIQSRKYYKANKFKMNQNSKEYAQKNSEKVREYQKQYGINNRKRLKQQGKEYRENNIEKVKMGKKYYYETNKQKILDKAIKWSKDNPEKRKRIGRDYYHRNKDNSQFIIMNRLRARIRAAIRGQKSDTTKKLIGCSFEELIGHIRKQFTKGMTIKELLRGKIHIDHIQPCSNFDLTDPKQQKQCFHYTNLQPLWKSDNLSKKNNSYYYIKGDPQGKLAI